MVCIAFKPAQLLAVFREVVLGRSYQQVALPLGGKLDMETKYISRTNTVAMKKISCLKNAGP
jgi:hypothetical protein